MPKGYPLKNCKICDRDVEECGPLSKRGRCEDCARVRYLDNIAQMCEHRGPNFEHWRRRHAAAVGGILVDDLIEGME